MIGLVQAAEACWTGTFGNYSTTANFENPAGQAVLVTVNDGCGISNTSGVGGNSVTLYVSEYMGNDGSIIPYNSSTLNQTFSHEIGHVLGATDQYVGAGTTSQPNNIMGSVGASATPQGSTIQQRFSRTLVA